MVDWIQTILQEGEYAMRCKIAVCDDKKSHAKHTEALVVQWAGGAGVQEQVSCFSSAEAFLFAYEEEQDFDLLLLDVEMGGMDGVSMAKLLRQQNDKIQIIFISGYADYIAEGYEVSALHYLTKPIDQEKLFSVLDRAIERLRQTEPWLTLELVEGTVRVQLDQIRYLDVFHNHVTVHAAQNYTLKRPLGEFEAKLDRRFFRIGRSCILNLSYVRSVSRQAVELTDGTNIPLPRGQYEKVNRAIIEQI